MILLLNIAPKSSAEALFLSARRLHCAFWKKYMLDKLPSGMGYSTIDFEFNGNELYVKYNIFK